MKAKKIKLAIFDMAGTTVYDRNYVQKIFIKSFENFNIHITPAQANQVMGIEKGKAITTILDQFRTTNKKIIKTEDILHYFNHEAIGYYLENSRPVAYAVQSFKKLKQHGVLIALNTGFGETVMNCIINSLGWQEYIDARVSAEQVRAGRPYPFMIDRLKKMTQIHDVDEIAKIGDTPSDLLEGYRSFCGLNIGICSANFPKETLETFPHTHLVYNLRQSVSIVLNHASA
jgi:phosphonatase-like hydrolase